ncbi:MULTISPECIES: CDP-alcohol phosphatidyltransferase family protein [Mesorhizobium]|uniref:CDP-alcohol phosphatidyltransferase family protein n=1 Tax=Mesorhizobium TaxID=68287 RepID=UPI0007EE0402|nr:MULTISPECIES: CDP-alcohol phosphatidyltransferase family protein [Mesorhizobium]PBB51886.1 hypothetical protein CK223_32660 [Mesorhizobium loti]QIA25535.1 hypothetical protein A9K68_030425 [Mesorhizobium sp. AA22]
MIRHLLDPANAITAGGIVLSMIAIGQNILGVPELGAAIALWALLADHLDGIVAKRTKGRQAETAEIGKNLDSLADLVSAGIFPAITILGIAQATPTTIATASLLVLSSALRLAYFNVNGSPGGRSTGLPTTYAVPVTAIVLLCRPFIPDTYFSTVLAASLLAVACLQVAPLQVPKTAGIGYLLVSLFCLATSLALLARVGMA